MEIDRLGAQEELGGDLAIGEPAGDRLGNAQLLGRELIGIAEWTPLEGASGAQLVARLLGPGRGTERSEHLERAAETLSRLDPPTSPRQRAANASAKGARLRSACPASNPASSSASALRPARA
jgi:hypothetical protein